MAPRVTALVAERRDRVRVELDGAPWRTVPAAAVVSAGLVRGVELDRPRARALRRELRRVEALALATAALGRREHTAADLDAKLARRGVSKSERTRALETLERAGYVDESRFASGRAALLATRGFGNEGIRYDLERAGANADVIAAAIDELASEAERAAEIVARSGRDARTARRLAAKGFAPETVESLFSEV